MQLPVLSGFALRPLQLLQSFLLYAMPHDLKVSCQNRQAYISSKSLNAMIRAPVQAMIFQPVYG
jgi:hypothetical protein